MYKADDLSMSSHATESHNSLQYYMLPNEKMDFDFLNWKKILKEYFDKEYI